MDEIKRIEAERASLREQSEFWSTEAWAAAIIPLAMGLILVPAAVVCVVLLWSKSVVLVVAFTGLGALTFWNWLKSVRLAFKICRFHRRKFRRWPWQY